MEDLVNRLHVLAKGNDLTRVPAWMGGAPRFSSRKF
jgi:hypothetical protein